MDPEKSATEVLRETSRTFYPSIVRLPPRIREAVMSAYLALRAIDEIEDHPHLDNTTKVGLLRALSRELRARNQAPSRLIHQLFETQYDSLPEVTMRIDEWLALAPNGSAAFVAAATSMMAQRMAWWVSRRWLIATKCDLDKYTFSVAGAVGLLLSDLWVWYDGTPSRKNEAIAYGRGLQAVNILRNRTEDLARGVDFFPQGWIFQDFVAYTRTSLLRGDAYVCGFAPGPAREFCRGPQALAHATLKALERGEPKLTKSAVIEILGIDDLTGGGKPDHPERVVLVDEHDEVVGTEEKIKAHQSGALHRAFSVFVFNSTGQLLLQKRTNTKYHSKGLWSNTCCGHPRPGETIEQASRRRLSEEMGFDSRLKKICDFVYRVTLEEGLVEYEFDHVLVGKFDGLPNPDPDEVAEWKWIDLADVGLDIDGHPERYTYWFSQSLKRFRSRFRAAALEVSSGARVS